MAATTVRVAPDLVIAGRRLSRGLSRRRDGLPGNLPNRFRERCPRNDPAPAAHSRPERTPHRGRSRVKISGECHDRAPARSGQSRAPAALDDLHRPQPFLRGPALALRPHSADGAPRPHLYLLVHLALLSSDYAALFVAVVWRVAPRTTGALRRPARRAPRARPARRAGRAGGRGCLPPT